MISDARGGHVSPGIYSEEKDVTYSVQSLGITSLGLVGETLYGPAFQNVEIEKWSDFVDYFGGCSPEKFKGTGLPKYELPYVAKSYLEESKRLNVVRVLGLSGYLAGPAFVISASGDSASPVVILRSKMEYSYSAGDLCSEDTNDVPTQLVESVEIVPYTSKVFDSRCAVDATASGSTTTDPAKFGLKVKMSEDIAGYASEYVYNVSLRSSDSDYIYSVLSSSPATGTTPIYIEAVYENAWDGEAMSVCETVSSASVTYDKYYMATPSSEEDTYDLSEVAESDIIGEQYVTATPDEVSGNVYSSSADVQYVKVSYTDEVVDDYYSNFLEEYRPAQTPWIVSDAVVTYADGAQVATMKKLFKFVTISDGAAANYQVKVSIENIKPNEGTFDVIVRDFNDTDSAPKYLEKFSNCNMVEGDSNYIAFKIGTIDGGYEAKSKYVTVEMADGVENLVKAIPAGFLGYPMPSYGKETKVEVAYNTKLNSSIKARRQYFGISNIKGIDEDVFAYKGKYFYDSVDTTPELLTNGFHMDSSINGYGEVSASTIYVDGVSGYSFTTVSYDKVGAEKYIPRLIAANYINDTIYADVKTRKFTVGFYGGFDGWDVNRTSRTNTDNYKASKYSVAGSSIFTKVSENGLNASLDLPSTAITTDYYAYLAGYRVFANPQDIEINVIATPCIDWYHNTLLTEDALEIVTDVEDGRGGDSLYVMNSPAELDADELAREFDATEIDSSYACTYAPWVMYYDSSNKRYLNLPVTKDVVRNLAATDNNSYPWFAPAGIERGEVKCVKAMYKTTLAAEDTLYEGRINPVKTFGQDGVKVWGQKTTYSENSPLNRINVRRLMIRVKKLITSAARALIFEQYDDTLEKQFRSIVEPILSNVKANRGITDFKIMTEVTAETRDQHILPARILIKPTPALEYISISFVVYPESVEFDEN